MKLVGFGCSFTYGSELVDPALNIDHHPRDNWRYRETNCWLGQLAKLFDCIYDNRGEPANSNFAIQYQVADYILNKRNDNEQIVICIGWSAPTRMSWYDDSWTHNGFVSNKTGWTGSAKEWAANSTPDNLEMYSSSAKLFVNSICEVHNIPILQFNALGRHKTTKYKNYFADGNTMDEILKHAQNKDSRLDLFASGGHPNEAGHEYFTIRLHDFAKQRII